MASDSIKVAIRVRPTFSKEKKENQEERWIISDTSIAPKNKPGSYQFDKIFDSHCTTYDVYEEMCMPIVQSALDGFHGTIFAYGQSSSGKTHTMTGTSLHPGIIPLAVGTIFEFLTDSDSQREFLLRTSYMEIYNERVTDLLSCVDRALPVREDAERNVYVGGLTEEVISSSEELFDTIQSGEKRRHVAETKQNDHSSRSHCILRIIIESRNLDEEAQAVKVSHLNFVDLAGSEKVSENSKSRQKEGCLINKSLFQLSLVIRKLSEGCLSGDPFVGFRDSQLTRILKNSLGGNSKTAIICTIAPCSLEESHSSLRFASQAKTIENKPVVNEVLSDQAMLKKYRHELEHVKKTLNELNSVDVQNVHDLKRQLDEKETATRRQAEIIARLRNIIVTSGHSNVESNTPKKRKRETLCAGKGMFSGLRGSLSLPHHHLLQPFDEDNCIPEQYDAKDMASDSIKVAIRARPTFSKEKKENQEERWIISDTSIAPKNKPGSYQFERRHVAETKQNDHSSRSHCILRIKRKRETLCAGKGMFSGLRGSLSLPHHHLLQPFDEDNCIPEQYDAKERRHVAETKQNDHSSRSHCILRIKRKRETLCAGKGMFSGLRGSLSLPHHHLLQPFDEDNCIPEQYDAKDMASDSIKVAIRVRPTFSKEKKENQEERWIISDTSIAPKNKPGSYQFDKIFDSHCTTYDVYEEMCMPIVQSALDGFHGTIFAYGQSSSGKTHTMTGTSLHPGIIPLAVGTIFEFLTDSDSQREFLLRTSYMEIYNERVTDLLSCVDRALPVREDAERNVYVGGLTEEVISSSEELFDTIQSGEKRRHVAETKQNDHSSRSHCILRIIIESRNLDEEAQAVKVSHLNFVDLAGSEKVSENSKSRQKEGCLINKSLFQLSLVIRKLSEGCLSGDPFVGFRDSQLTRILKNSLGGNSKTAIICTIAPCSLEESHSSLRFASQAKTIENKPVVNEVLSDQAMLKKYRHELEHVKKTLNELNSVDVQNVHDLKRQLDEKETATRRQAEIIATLRNIIVTSGHSNVESNTPKKRKRETLCAGKGMFSGLRGSLSLPHHHLLQPFDEDNCIPEQYDAKEADDSFFLPALGAHQEFQEKCEEMAYENSKLVQELEKINNFNQTEATIREEELEIVLAEVKSLKEVIDEKQKKIHNLETDAFNNLTVENCASVYTGEELINIQFQQKEEQIQKQSSKIVFLNDTREKVELALEQLERKYSHLEKKMKNELERKEMEIRTRESTIEFLEETVMTARKDQNLASATESIAVNIQEKLDELEKQNQVIATLQETVDSLKLEETNNEERMNKELQDKVTELEEKDALIKSLEENIGDLFQKLEQESDVADSMREEMTEKQREIQGQMETICSLRQEIVDMGEKNELLTSEIGHVDFLQSEVAQKQEELQIQNDEISSLQQKIVDMEKKNELMTSEIGHVDFLQSEVAQKQEELQIQNDEINSLQKKIVDMEKKNELRTKIWNVDLLRSEVAQKTELQTQNDKISSLQQEIVDMEKKNEFMTSEETNNEERMNKELQDKVTELEEKDALIKSLEENIGDLFQKLEQESDVADSMREEMTEKQREIQGQMETICSLRQEIVDMGEKNELLTSEIGHVDFLQSEVAQKQEELQIQNDEISSLQQKIVDMEKKNELMTSEIGHVDFLQSEVAQKQEELQIQNDEINSLQKKIVDMEKKNELRTKIWNVDLLRSEVAQKTELQTQNDKISSLQQEIVDMEKKNEFMTSEETNNEERMNKELQDKVTELEEKDALIKSLEENIGDLFQKLEQESDVADSMREEMTEKQREIQGQMETICSLRQEIVDMGEKNELLTSESDVADSMREEMTEKQREIQGQMETICSLRQEIVDMGEKNELLTSEIGHVDFLQSEVAQKQEELQIQNDEISSLQQKIVDMEKKNELMTSEIGHVDFLQSEVAQKQEELQIQNDEINSLQKKIVDMEKKNELRTKIWNVDLLRSEVAQKTELQTQNDKISSLQQEIVDMEKKNEFMTSEETNNEERMNKELQDKVTELEEKDALIKSLEENIGDLFQKLEQEGLSETDTDSLKEDNIMKQLEIEELNENINSLQAENVVLKEANNSVKSQSDVADSMREEMTEKQREIQGQMETICSLRQEIVDMGEKNELLTSEIGHVDFLQSEVAQKQEELQIQNDEISSLQQKIVDMEKKNELMTSEIGHVDFLQSEVAQKQEELQIQNDEINSLQKKIVDMEKKNELRTKIWNVDLLRSEVAQKTELQTQNDKISSLQQEIVDMEKKNEFMTSEETNNEERMNKELQDKVTELEEKDALIKSLEENIGDLFQKLEQEGLSETDTDSLKEDNIMKQLEIEELNENINSLQAENVVLKEANNSVKSQSDVADSMREEMTEKQREIQGQMETICSLRQEIVDMGEKNELLTSEIGHVDFLQSEVAQKQEELQIQNDEISSLQQKIVDMEKKNELMTSEIGHVDFLQSEVAQKQEELQIQNDEINSLQKKIVDMEKKNELRTKIWNVDLLRSEVAQKTELQTQNDKISSLQQEIVDMEKKNEFMTSEIGNIDLLRSEVAQKTELQTQNDKISSLQQEIVDMKKKNKLMTSENQDSKEELMQVTTQCEELESEFKDFEKETNRLNVAIADLQDKEETIVKERRELFQHNQTVRREYCVLSTENMQQETKIEEMRDEMAKLKQQKDYEIMKLKYSINEMQDNTDQMRAKMTANIEDLEAQRKLLETLVDQLKKDLDKNLQEKTYLQDTTVDLNEQIKCLSTKMECSQNAAGEVLECLEKCEQLEKICQLEKERNYELQTEMKDQKLKYEKYQGDKNSTINCFKFRVQRMERECKQKTEDCKESEEIMQGWLKNSKNECERLRKKLQENKLNRNDMQTQTNDFMCESCGNCADTHLTSIVDMEIPSFLEVSISVPPSASQCSGYGVGDGGVISHLTVQYLEAEKKQLQKTVEKLKTENISLQDEIKWMGIRYDNLKSKSIKIRDHIWKQSQPQPLKTVTNTHHDDDDEQRGQIKITPLDGAKCLENKPDTN